MTRLALVPALLLSAATIVAVPAASDEAPDASLYRSLCAECHGEDARGDGPKAPKLEPAPPDLTRLADVDPALLRVEVLSRVIDGRRTVRAHGQSRMPVWGEQLAPGVADPVMREQARIRLVQSVAEYLLSIQRPTSSSP